MRKSGLLMASMALAVLLVCGVALAATVECVRGAELCDGTDEADTLKGTPKKDTMRGLEGNDKLYANAGNDAMTGGSGNDLMRGGRGADDTLFSNVSPEAPPDERPYAGNDTIYGGSGNDYYIHDREGRNLLSGGDGDDGVIGTGTVLGDRGNDLLRGSSVEDAEGNVIFKGRAEGGSGDDFVRVIGTGTMLGGPGDDAFDKVPCRDRCLPPDNGEGPRVLRGGAGNDVLRLFGPHDDTIYLTDGERDRVISCGPGTDTIYFDRGLDKIRAGASCGERHPQ